MTQPPTPDEATTYELAAARLSHWRKRTIALLWVTYAAFYLCRVNLPAAQKDIAAERGLSKRQLGGLLSLLKACYAVGQFVNGMLTDRLGVRALVVAGLSVSAGLNLVFAHLGSYHAMAAVWAANGYFQACGWTPIVRTIANWFPPRLRDAASGIIGVSYILGSGVSWLLAGNLSQAFGWRYAFWVPPWICLAVALLFLLALREHPEDAGFAPSDEAPRARDDDAPLCSLAGLSHPRLWALATAMLCFNFGYHGLLDWMPHYLAEARSLPTGAAATHAFLMPLGGAAGCIILTQATRRRGKQLGPLTISAIVAAFALATYVFPHLVEHTPAIATAWPFLLGALSSIPASIMACSMAADTVPHTHAGTAAGVVDAVGYVGSAGSGWLSGRVLEQVGRTRGQDAAWRAVWRIWPVGVLAAAGIVAALAARHPADEAETV